MLCYHKEYFALGLIGALFIVAIFHLFEDVILGWLEKVSGYFLPKITLIIAAVMTLKLAIIIVLS